MGLVWEKGANNGGTYVLDYRLSYDQGVGEWVVLYSGITNTNIVVTDLTPGMEYHFKVQSRNSFGFSDYSTELIVLSGFVPFQPDPPTTRVSGAFVVIEWQAPTSNGSPIISYKIEVRHSDFLTFSEDVSNCDGTQLSVITATACSIPLSTLTASPYSLTRGLSVWAKITASN